MTGKARRGATQIIVGLLVDRGGFPLQVGCFRGQPGRDHHYHPRGGGLPGRWRHRRARSGRRAPACCRLLTWRYWIRRSRGSSPGARQVSALCWRERPRRRLADRHHHLRKRLEERAGRA